MKHELLSPAGSLEICRAVIDAGADAVYLGGEKYGARAFAKNFSQDELFEALDYAHLHGKKIFLTVNTLVKNKEFGRELYEYIKPYYLHGLDAIIVQDYGVFQFVKENFPELPVHASTQMSIANVEGAAFLKAMGADRVVTARELSLSEIRAIYDGTGLEIESFIHGALCYCYSGQCLMSSMLGGRSGNRGRCAQPCRLAYDVVDGKGKELRRKEKYPLSPKDLCTLELIPKLCEAGIYSFKIEGRMKQLAYAAGVTEIYRDYLNRYEQDPKNYRVDSADMERLMQLGNRSGFTKGYYELRNGREMMALSDSSHSSSLAKDAYQPPKPEKLSLDGFVVMRRGEPAALTVVRGKDSVAVQGAKPQGAQNRPLSSEDVEKRLRKTGDTPFTFDQLEIEMEEGLFLPVSALNELRRDALEAFASVLTSAHYRVLPEKELQEAAGTECRSNASEPSLNVLISSEEMLEEMLSFDFVSMISLESSIEASPEHCVERIHSVGKQAGLFLPYVLRQNSSDALRKQAEKMKQAGFDRVFVRSYDELFFAEETLGFAREQIVLDYNMYVFSDTAARAFEKAGYSSYTASLELNRKEFRYMPNGQAQFLLYGYVPLMISAQCIYKNYDHCYQKEKKDTKNLFLKDRYFKKFFIKRDCKNCYNVIYNSQPVSLFHQAEEIRDLGFGSYRISFVSENKKQRREVMEAYEKAFIQQSELAPPAEKDSFTNGHFRRGVE